MQLFWTQSTTDAVPCQWQTEANLGFKLEDFNASMTCLSSIVYFVSLAPCMSVRLPRLAAAAVGYVCPVWQAGTQLQLCLIQSANKVQQGNELH